MPQQPEDQDALVSPVMAKGRKAPMKMKTPGMGTMMDNAGSAIGGMLSGFAVGGAIDDSDRAMIDTAPPMPMGIVGMTDGDRAMIDTAPQGIRAPRPELLDQESPWRAERGPQRQPRRGQNVASLHHQS
jgi:hypothetical protein